MSCVGGVARSTRRGLLRPLASACVGVRVRAVRVVGPAVESGEELGYSRWSFTRTFTSRHRFIFLFQQPDPNMRLKVVVFGGCACGDSWRMRLFA